MASELKIASAFVLRQALADLLLGRQRAAEDDGARAREEPAARRQGDVGGRLGDQLAGPDVAEERGVRALDPDAPVRRFAALQGPPASDQRDSSRGRVAARGSVAAPERDVGDDRVFAHELGMRSLGESVIQQSVAAMAACQSADARSRSARRTGRPAARIARDRRPRCRSRPDARSRSRASVSRIR